MDVITNIISDSRIVVAIVILSAMLLYMFVSKQSNSKEFVKDSIDVIKEDELNSENSQGDTF